MKSWLRHHRYAFKISLQRLGQNPISSLANIIVIALVLSLPIIGASVLKLSQPLVHELAIQPEITLFLKANTSADEQAKLLAQIKSNPAVSQAQFLSKEQALQFLQKDETWALALQALAENPLPDAIIVTLHESDQISKDAENLRQQWQNKPIVDLVQLDGQWVQRLESILSFIKYGIAFMALAVAIVVIATVFNTVRLQALSQREEITVARLVGATESFVRRPFLYLGALTAASAFIIAVIITAFVLLGLNMYLQDLAQTYSTSLVLQLPNWRDLLLAAIVIIILGALAARLSVTRHYADDF